MNNLTPCYTYSGQPIKNSQDDNSVDCDNAICAWNSNGYRLPSEGEWQYAASNKGDTQPDYASGAGADYTDTTETGKVAWYTDNSGSHTHVVGTKNANALDIHDMSGNVVEWCWDWYTTYSSAAKTDYRGPSTGSTRLKRGGAWHFSNSSLQIGYRDSDNSGYETNFFGFRVAQSF